MTDRELMQMALDTLELVTHLTSYDDEVYEAIFALRARLAEPEPEPVDKAGSPCKEFWDWLPKAYRDGDKGNEQKFTKYNMEVAYLAGTRSRREWQGLTDEEMFSLWVRCPAETEDRFAFARAIEQALKEKNT